MKLIKKYKDLELIVEEKLLNKLGAIGAKHFPNEFGGFLLGHYSEDFKSVYIDNYLLPKKYKAQPTLFERSIEGTVSRFKKLFKEKNQYYIGEWHTHPNGSTMFSQTDLNAMIETVQCDTVQIKNPLLLILDVNEEELNNYTFYYYNNKNLIPYE